MLVNRKDISLYIPQRMPIVLVHGLIHHDASKSTSVFKIEQHHLMVRDGRLLESGLMENIAQTAALRSGYDVSVSRTDTGSSIPPVGFIAALKDFRVHELPRVGDVLTTTVEIAYEAMGMQVIIGRAMIGDVLMAESEMKIFLSN